MTKPISDTTAVTSVKLANLKKDLSLLGLTDKELLIYISAIQLTNFSMAEIAKKSGIKRPTCYLLIENLVQKGVVARVPDSRNTRFIAVNPQILLEKIKNSMDGFKQAIVTLNSLRNPDKEAAHIQLFHGLEGVKQIHYAVLEDKPDHIDTIINLDFIEKYLSADFSSLWVKKRMEKDINIRSLRPFRASDVTEDAKPRNQKGREVRFLPEEFQPNSMLFIWQDKVGFMSDRREGISFVVFSKEFSNMMRTFYEFIWSSSRKL